MGLRVGGGVEGSLKNSDRPGKVPGGFEGRTLIFQLKFSSYNTFFDSEVSKSLYICNDIRPYPSSLSSRKQHFKQKVSTFSLL